MSHQPFGSRNYGLPSLGGGGGGGGGGPSSQGGGGGGGFGSSTTTTTTHHHRHHQQHHNQLGGPGGQDPVAAAGFTNSNNSHHHHHHPGGMPSFPSTSHHHHHHGHQPHGPAIESLTLTAQSVGLSIEQLAAALSSSPNLKALSVESGNQDSQKELALSLYRTESLALYRRCMLLAGFDVQAIEETSPEYLQFAFKAWQEEGKRLQDMMGTEMTLQAPVVANLSTTQQEAAQAQAHAQVQAQAVQAQAQALALQQQEQKQQLLLQNRLQQQQNSFLKQRLNGMQLKHQYNL